MSMKQLQKAARLKVPQQLPDIDSKLMMMCMADRANDQGAFTVLDNDRLMGDLAQEVNAVRARLTGDQFMRLGVDNDRVARVVAAYKEAEDE